MEIDIFDGDIIKEDIVKTPHTIACRGVIEKDGKYLVVNASKFDITMFPGGRLEENETLEQCCQREVLEETGIICKVISKKISINEYFIDSSWTNVYFKCEYIKDTKTTNFTEEEISIGLKIQWKTLEELLDTYENNMTLHEHGPNVHNREFLALIHSI